ncbi:MAG: methylated-DNA--[protein]-cysteine S-methyltransferase [Betaproteobacteria bacterium]
MTGRGPVAGQTETRYATPFAVLGIVTDGKVVTSVRYLPRNTAQAAPQDCVAERACREVERYLADPAYLFTVPYRLEGTPFQCRVWHEIEKLREKPREKHRDTNCSIKTITYGEMAHCLRSGPRAVGGACGANPIPLIVPCHRVLAAGGGLGGFMGGKDPFPLSVKRWLLQHEGILEADH